MQDDGADILESLKQRKTKHIMEMIDHDPSLLMFVDGNGVSLLLLSFYFGNLELAAFILSRRAPADVYEAVVSGNITTTVGFLDSNPLLLNSYSPDGFTPLGFAAYFNHAEIARHLLDRGANPNLSSKNSFNVTPLHSAVAANSYEITKMLLDRGANPNAMQQNDVTPLHSAAHNGNAGIVEILLEHHANTNAVTTDGKTPAAMARESLHEAIAFMLSKGKS